jgi:hypothetical protein
MMGFLLSQEHIAHGVHMCAGSGAKMRLYPHALQLALWLIPQPYLLVDFTELVFLSYFANELGHVPCSEHNTCATNNRLVPDVQYITMGEVNLVATSMHVGLNLPELFILFSCKTVSCSRRELLNALTANRGFFVCAR